MSHREMRIHSAGAITDWQAHPSGLTIQFRHGSGSMQLISDHIVRLRYVPPGITLPHPRHWDALEPLEPGSSLQCSRNGESVIVNGPEWQVHWNLATGRSHFLHNCGAEFAKDAAPPMWRESDLDDTAMETQPGDALPDGAARTTTLICKELAAADHVFGLGQRDGALDRRGRRWGNWTRDIYLPGNRPPRGNMYQAHPFVMVARPGFAWGLYLHSSWYSEFDAGRHCEEHLTVSTLGGVVDSYILTGPSMAHVVQQLTRLTGRPLLPPLWSLGFHQSRWSYPDHDTVTTLAEQFRRRQLPLDAIHLDIDYMRGYRDFTWDPQRFPDPAHTIAQLHQRQVKAVAIVDPGVKADLGDDYPVARSGLQQQAFLRNPDGSTFEGFCWPDASLFPDFCSAPARRWWGDQHAALLDVGVDGIWNDMNEPAIADRSIHQHGAHAGPVALATSQGDEEESTCHAEAHNRYGALMAQATWEGLRRLTPERRPWVLTRSAFAGTQRHAVTWMGDNRSDWPHLAVSIPQLLNMGLSGMPHCGADIGGFFGDCTPELFARWIQLGVFYPFMRCHTAIGTRSQEPWRFGDAVEQISRAAIELRYRLLPYIYTLSHEAHRTGEPLLRPLCYEFPNHEPSYQADDQFMLGPHLLAAPFTAPGQTERCVLLPDGPWTDFWTGNTLQEDATTVASSWMHTPLYIRPDGAVPLGNVRASTEQPLEELTWLLAPRHGGSGILIEDDGIGSSAPSCETRIEFLCDHGRLEIRLEPRRGAYTPPPRQVALRIHLEHPPQRVSMDSRPAPAWRWSEQRRALAVDFPDDGLAHHILIR